MEDLQYNRKIELNEWIITARWFYMVAVFLIGIMGNSLIWVMNPQYSFLPVFILLMVLVFSNSYFYNAITGIKRMQTFHKLKWLSWGQITLELFIITILLYLAEDPGVVSIFFFLPIISASIIFGIRGAVTTAILAGALINISAIVGYFNFLLAGSLDHTILSKDAIISFYKLTIDLIRVILTSNFYIIVALFSGYTSKFLFKREQRLMAQAETLIKASAEKESELKKKDISAQQLVKKDAVLTAINKELDKKIKELEQSERSLMKAFADLKEARMRSEQESNKIVAMIANFIDPIIVIDRDDRISLLNPAAKNIFGLIENDIGTQILSENNYSMANFKTAIKKEYTVKTSKEMKSENPMEEEIIINYNNQEYTYKVITENIIDNMGSDLGVMKIFYNLTREKMIDKLKSEFISIAAHQLRTPLAAIKWVIKMVLDGDTGKLNKDQQELLFKGYQSNERIITLVNDMLNVSRIEEGRYGYSFTSSDFKEALKIVLDCLEKPINDKKIKLLLNLPARNTKVYMDKEKMTLVLQNLLENAVKYTPEHGTIEVGLEYGRELLTFRVKDNGVGIPEKDQAKMFSKFFRAVNVVRMQTEGSGLGLFIVKNIVERHNGDITFKSEEGKGTEFVVTLPLK